MQTFKILAMFIAITLFGSSILTSSANSDVSIRNLIGSWTFKTTEYREGACNMQGNMKVSTAGKDEYKCEIYAEETCTMWGTFLVYQTCSIDQVDDQFTVVSSVERILESTMEISEVQYVPDNFILKLVDSHLMTGNLVSAVIAPVRFERIPDSIS